MLKRYTDITADGHSDAQRVVWKVKFKCVTSAHQQNIVSWKFRSELSFATPEFNVEVAYVEESLVSIRASYLEEMSTEPEGEETMSD
jgi:hypothetical protein